MSKTAILLRSDGNFERLARVMPFYLSLTNFDVFIVRDATSPHKTADSSYQGIPIIDLEPAFVDQRGLQSFKKMTWQCGDYFLYAARAALPDYEYYFLIDDDVYFGVFGNIFFRQTEEVDADLFGVRVARRREGWAWYDSMAHLYPGEVFGLLGPMYRLSGRAIDFLIDKRVAYEAPVDPSVYDRSDSYIQMHANDEAFVPTTLRQHGYVLESLSRTFPVRFEGFFTTEKPIVLEEMGLPHLKGKIAHPLCDESRARMKFGILVRKYGWEKIEERMSQIVESCGSEVWERYSGFTVQEVEANLQNGGAK